MRHALLAVVAICVAACGDGGGGNSNPTGPSTPPPAQNRAPTITSATVNPTFGIADLQVFNFTAVGNDQDGDALTYSWTILGSQFSGATPQVQISGPGGSVTATVTVSDGRGATASANVNFVVGSMAGTWRVTSGLLTNMSLDLRQSSSGIVSGSWNQPGVGGGVTDPAQPGIINAAGQVTLRMKVTTGRFNDFNMIGTMDTTGRLVTGNLQGSGFTGQPFVLQKQ